MLRVISTPWAQDALRAEPMEAMAIEAAARVTPMAGTLQLFGKSARGPWQAIIHTADRSRYVGGARDLVGAVLDAFNKADAGGEAVR